MDRQQTENLFRRLKGHTVAIKTVSGGVYEGRIEDVTDDYLCIIERQNTEATKVYLFYTSLESMIVSDISSS
jgi:ferredoxin-fold anticodon binding domain-containing protein